MRLARVLLLCGLILALPAIAGAKPPPIRAHVTPNGLDVLVVENHSLPLVTIELAVKSGAMNEPPGPGVTPETSCPHEIRGARLHAPIALLYVRRLTMR